MQRSRPGSRCCSTASPARPPAGRPSSRHWRSAPRHRAGPAGPRPLRRARRSGALRPGAPGGRPGGAAGASSTPASADVVGYSMGARLALQLVIDHPAAVRSLVLESPSAGIADAEERARRRAADERLADRLEEPGLDAFVDAWESQPLFASQAGLSVGGARTASGRAPGPRPARPGRLAAWRRPGRHDPAAATTRVPSAARRSSSPGSLDAVGHERARGVAGAIAQARFELIERAGHAPHLEQPEVFHRPARPVPGRRPAIPTH